MAVAAGAIADAAVPAVVALLDLAAEGSSATLLDGHHDTSLQGGGEVSGEGAEGLPVATEDIGDLKLGTGHRSARWPSATACGRGSRSSGLVAEQTLEQAICR